MNPQIKELIPPAMLCVCVTLAAFGGSFTGSRSQTEAQPEPILAKEHHVEPAIADEQPDVVPVVNGPEIAPAVIVATYDGDDGVDVHEGHSIYHPTDNQPCDFAETGSSYQYIATRTNAKGDDWHYVSMSDGRRGWVRGAFSKVRQRIRSGVERRVERRQSRRAGRRARGGFFRGCFGRR